MQPNTRSLLVAGRSTGPRYGVGLGPQEGEEVVKCQIHIIIIEEVGE